MRVPSLPPVGDGRRRLALALYLGAVGILALTTQVLTPIIAFDNDLWYHLAHGRHLYSEGMPATSYFSFVEPIRSWVDYYWLFHAVAYPVHQALGYGGLIALRALLYGLFLAGVGLYVLRLRRPEQTVWPALLFGLIVTQSFERFVNLRPHSCSYVLLISALLLLESRSRWTWLLPIVAVAWVNLHGVIFPVLLLVCGAYGLEVLIAWWRTRTLEVAARRTLIAAALAMAAILVNPAGFRLLAVPFHSLYFVSSHLQELGQPPWSSFLNFSLSPDGFAQRTIANLLLALGLLAAIGSIVRGRPRVSHLALAIGATILALRAGRFSHEMALLLLPLLIDHGPPWLSAAPARSPSLPIDRDPRRRGRAFAAGVLLLTPLPFFAARWPDAGMSYPLAWNNLPHGTAAFLTTHTQGGRVMNDPNFGGYLQWALPPEFKIFMNMEMPFIYADEDVFELFSAYSDRAALARFLDRYNPDFIAVAIVAQHFPTLIADHPRYRLVYFDDVFQLYADGGRHPELVARHELKWAQPTLLASLPLASYPTAHRDALRAELERLESVDSRVASTSLALATLDGIDGRPERALERVARAIRKNPRSAPAYALRGDAQQALGDLEAAIGSYRKALERTPDPYRGAPIQRSLAAALSRAGQDTAAFRAFEEAVLASPLQTPAAEYYQLALYAARAGEIELARVYLERATAKTAPENVELERRIEIARGRLAQDL